MLRAACGGVHHSGYHDNYFDDWGFVVFVDGLPRHMELHQSFGVPHSAWWGKLRDGDAGADEGREPPHDGKEPEAMIFTNRRYTVGIGVRMGPVIPPEFEQLPGAPAVGQVSAEVKLPLLAETAHGSSTAVVNHAGAAVSSGAEAASSSPHGRLQQQRGQQQQQQQQKHFVIVLVSFADEQQFVAPYERDLHMFLLVEALVFMLFAVFCSVPCTSCCGCFDSCLQHKSCCCCCSNRRCCCCSKVTLEKQKPE